MGKGADYLLKCKEFTDKMLHRMTCITLAGRIVKYLRGKGNLSESETFMSGIFPQQVI